MIGIILGVGAVLLYYYYLTKNFDYWIKRGIPGPKPLPFFGNFKDVALCKIHISDFIKKLYDIYPNELVFGIFKMRKPVIVLRDPVLINDVFIKSFSVFADRGLSIHLDLEPLANHLVFLQPKEWKILRSKLTPIFSSGKLRNMAPLVEQCMNNLHQFMDKELETMKEMDCLVLSAKYTTAVIAVCAFGLQMNTLSGEDNEFYMMGRSIFADSWTNRLLFLSRGLPYWVAFLIKPFFDNSTLRNFFVDLFTNTMKLRTKNNVRRNDFVDLLMDLKKERNKIGDQELTDEFMTAQAFIFFAAGFETSSFAISHALYELSLNQDIQDKLRKEVNKAADQNQGRITYDVIKNLRYINNVFKETLRKYPPVTVLQRLALEDHTFPGTNISITKGTLVFIPVYALHYDPNIYPNPNEFDPERFSDESINSRSFMTHLPFGDGPRNCIAARFALMQTNLALAMLVKNFKFEVCEKTSVSYIKNNNVTLLVPRDGIHLKITKA